MSDSNAPTLTEPVVEAIIILLDPAITAALWRVARRRLTTALCTTLAQPVRGWRVSRAPYTDEVAYDLLPPDERSLTAADAWDLTYALRDLPDVQDAQPSFALIQDAFMPPVDSAKAPVAMALPADVDPCADDAAPASLNPDDIDWSARLVDAPCAWRLAPPPEGRTRGEGIRIGHPDSGYLK